MSKHVHADLIKAWADGEKIQVLLTTSPGCSDWIDVNFPIWNPKEKYRIKPRSPAYQVRFFIYRPYCAYYEHVCANVRNKEDEKQWENDPRFIKWITDWVEYDV